jgi:NitT/TauT family transport system substrate-binding protein
MTFNAPFHLSLGCLLVVGLFVTGCSRSNAPETTSAAGPDGAKKELMPIKMQLDWYPAPEHGGFFQAVGKGYYKDAGLDVAISSGGPGAFALQKVSTGLADFAIGAEADVVLSIKQGLPLVIICAYMQHDPQAIMVHEESSVHSFKDLDGKSVMGVPGANWISYLQFHYGIKFNTIPTDYGLARFVAEKDMIQQVFISNEPFNAELHGAKNRALLISDSGFDPYRVVYTSRKFAREHPEMVTAFVAATIKGWADFLHGDASAALAKIMLEDPIQTPAVMSYSMGAMKTYKLVEGDPAKGERLGLMTTERLKALEQSLVDIKVLDAPMPIADFASFDFLPPELTTAAK